MHFRFRFWWASLPLAAALLLLPAAALRAQTADETPADDEEVAEESGDGLAGKGSLGFSLGVMKFTGGSDLSDGSTRPILRGSFKYVWNNRLVTVFESGWGWNSYGEGGEFEGPDSVGTLATVIPTTLGLDYRFQTGNPTISPRVGGGIGFYALDINSGRTNDSRDPVTDAKRTASGLGMYGKAGCEFLLKPTFALNTDLLYHMAFTGDEEKFPAGFLDENASFVELRVGLSHYFTIRRMDAASAGEDDEDSDE